MSRALATLPGSAALMSLGSPRRTLFVILGSLCVAVGIAGIAIPLLPTTPFLLLASACYVRGSERLHRKLLDHRHLGPYIATFQQGGGIPRRAKLVTISLLWASMLAAIAYVSSVAIDIALLVVGLAVSSWIATRPTLSGQASRPHGPRDG